MAVIPRKPERFEEVAELINASEFSSVRYSRLKESNAAIDNKPDVIVGDTMGDLKKFYSLAAAVFVGRTLVPMGGSDMMEPAALGKFTSFGPHTFNFKQTVDALLKAKHQCMQIASNRLEHPEIGIPEKLLDCLTSP